MEEQITELDEPWRSQVTAVPRKTISQKRIPARPGNGLIFKGLLLRSLAEYPVTNREGHIKPLKIRPSAIEPIDIVLRGSVVTYFVSPACCGLPVLPQGKTGCELRGRKFRIR
jgi:hypothetical protein